MARYKPIDWGLKLLPIDRSCRLLHLTFERVIAQTSYNYLFAAKKMALSTQFHKYDNVS
jgi:hypothetical protein